MRRQTQTHPSVFPALFIFSPIRLSSVLSLRGPRLEEAGACAGGHVTGYFAGGSHEGLQRARQTHCCSRLTHLAKLNPNCHMNYSIIFTEISFSPETSSCFLTQRNAEHCWTPTQTHLVCFTLIKNTASFLKACLHDARFLAQSLRIRPPSTFGTSCSILRARSCVQDCAYTLQDVKVIKCLFI